MLRLPSKLPPDTLKGAIAIGITTPLCLFALVGFLSSQNPLDVTEDSTEKRGAVTVPNLETFDSPNPPNEIEDTPTADPSSVTLTPELSLFADPVEAVAPVEESLFLDSVSPFVGNDASVSITLLRQQDGSVETHSLADYLWCVVSAEMPASFPLEALKAQVVAARTYTAQRMENPKHSNALICDDSGCCQAYLDKASRLNAWGSDAALYQSKLDQALAQTDGLYVLYQNKPIDALFFSSSPGRTLGAQEVWNSSLPYLQSVSSPEGSSVPNYRTQAILSRSDVAALLQNKYSQIELNDSPSTWFADRIDDSAGGVAQINIGGISLTGPQLRSLFSLRSTHFTIQYSEGAFFFNVTGYGHNVGMSQYGAKTMAEQGHSFQSILTWYYTDTTVTNYQIKS